MPKKVIGVPIQKGQKLALKQLPAKKFTDEEVVRIGVDLVKWVKDNLGKEGIVHLSQFYVLIEDIDRDEWKNLCDRVLFTPYYKKALDMMAVQTILNSDIPTAYGSRFLAIYSKELRDHEKEIQQEKLAKEDQDRKMNLVDLRKALADESGYICQK